MNLATLLISPLLYLVCREIIFRAERSELTLWRDKTDNLLAPPSFWERESILASFLKWTDFLVSLCWIFGFISYFGEPPAWLNLFFFILNSLTSNYDSSRSLSVFNSSSDSWDSLSVFKLDSESICVSFVNFLTGMLTYFDSEVLDLLSLRDSASSLSSCIIPTGSC